MDSLLSRRSFVIASAGAAALAPIAARVGTARAATPETSSNLPLPPGDHPWSRGFETLTSENDYLVEEVDGAVPGDLRGTLFRNGPAKNGIGGQWFGHWFDGDGMLSAITFDKGRVRYRNRYVRTQGYIAE